MIVAVPDKAGSYFGVNRTRWTWRLPTEEKLTRVIRLSRKAPSSWMLRSALVWMLWPQLLIHFRSFTQTLSIYTLHPKGTRVPCKACVKQDPVKVRACCWNEPLGSQHRAAHKLGRSSSLCAFLKPRRMELWACDSHPRALQMRGPRPSGGPPLARPLVPEVRRSHRGAFKRHSE